MGLFTKNKTQTDAVGLADVLANFDIVEVADGHILVEQPAQLPPVKLADTPALVELGTTRSTWSGVLRDDYNPELRGYKGLEKFDQMRRSDSTCKAALLVRKTPLLAARWFIEAASEEPKDVEAAEFVRWNLFQGMSTSFPQLLWELLGMLDFGFYAFEKVYAEAQWRDKDVIKWKKLAARHPMDLYQWEFDVNGGPQGAWFYDDPLSALGVFIPIDKLAVFTNEREGGNIEGVSVLRPAYKNWFYKENLYKIDAIQKERHGIGIPIIKLPPGFNPQDKNLAHEIGRNLRTNEKAHVVLPPNWDIIFAKLEGQPVDALESADHHARMIFQNILAEFLSPKSNVSNPENLKEIFLKSTRYIAEIVRDVFNKYMIPQLIDMNFDVDSYPELRVRRIGDIQDWRIITFAARNLVGAGILRPDEVLEDWFREEMDLPKADLKTLRQMEPKQIPSGMVNKGNRGLPEPKPSPAGLPRQSTANKQKIIPGQNAGKDNSGTSGVK